MELKQQPVERWHQTLHETWQFLLPKDSMQWHQNRGGELAFIGTWHLEVNGGFVLVRL